MRSEIKRREMTNVLKLISLKDKNDQFFEKLYQISKKTNNKKERL